MGIEKLQVQYLANNIRKAGYDLPKKRANGELRHLICDVLERRKLPYNREFHGKPVAMTVRKPTRSIK